MTDKDVVQKFVALDEEIGLLRTLRGLNAADKAVTEKRNAILVFSQTGELEIFEYRDATDALRALFGLEKKSPDSDIVLVRADTSEDVRLAFRNYFSDARDFIEMVEKGCAVLSGASNNRRKARVGRISRQA